MATVLAVVLVLAGGVVLWRTLAAGGTRPAEVLPDSTFAVLSVDLDPSAGQKVEAIRTLRKLPSWNERTGVKPDSDLIEVLFDRAQKEGFCPKLDYAEDVQPWIGQRAAIGGVSLGKDEATPVLALQVKDADEAKASIGDLVACADAGDDVGWTFTEDYLVLSDSTSHAKAIVKAGEAAPLAEDAAFQKWTEEAGGDGIVNAYLAKSSVTVLKKAFGSSLGGALEGQLDGQQDGQTGLGLGSGASTPYATSRSSEDDPGAALDKALKDFEGAAAVLRFEDGGIELSAAGGDAAKQAGSTAMSDHVTRLPKDTAAVLAVAVPDSAFDSLDAGPAEALLGTLEQETGLEVPEDLETLLGSALSISLGGDAPADLRSVSDPGDLPLGLLVDGDEDEIKDVIAKVEARTGRQLSDLPFTLESGDGKVALASTSTYAEKLLAGGSLGDDEDFEDVVPHADDSSVIAYANLQGAWTDALRDLARDEDDKDAKELVANLASLRAFGLSAWTEGDTAHGLVRLTVK